MVTEQDAHRAFEEEVGIQRGFRHLDIWTRAGYTVSGDRCKIVPPKRTQTSVFRKMAAREGYKPYEIKMFLELP